MENATKALLIAAAVLVAILIISLGLVVYNMAAETIESVNFSGQEVTAFNDKFLQYQGTKVRGSEVNALVQTVLSSNMQSRSEGLDPADKAKFVALTLPKPATSLKATDTSLKAGCQVNTSKLYDVAITMNATTGFVETIKVTESK